MPGRGVSIQHASDLLRPGDPALRQLDRITNGWGCTLDPDNPDHRLALEVGRALRAAGCELHNCGHGAATGSVCLIPSSSPLASYAGVIVTWAQHDVLAHLEDDSPLYDVYSTVQATMNRALGTVLRALGYEVGLAGRAHLVTGRRRHGR